MNCPVCHIRLSDDGREVLTLGGEKPIEGFESTYDGVVYRFDCAECKELFDFDPLKFVGGAACE